MTHTSTEQPEALERLRQRLKFTHSRQGHTARFVEAKECDVKAVIDLADSLHARVQELEAQLEAVGAGGVQPLSCKGCCKRGDIVQIAEPEKVDELNCVCGATWVRHSNGVYGMTYLPRPAPKGHSITDALEALQEAEAALEVACARLEKQRADYPVGATSEGKALMLVRKVLAAQAKQGGA